MFATEALANKIVRRFLSFYFDMFFLTEASRNSCSDLVLVDESHFFLLCCILCLPLCYCSFYFVFLGVHTFLLYFNLTIYGFHAHDLKAENIV